MAKVQEIAKLAEMLPESDQDFAYEFLKKLVLAWDPDFTKVTQEEARQLEEAERNFANGDTVSMDEIHWD